MYLTLSDVSHIIKWSSDYQMGPHYQMNHVVYYFTLRYQMDPHYQMDYVPVGERYAVESCILFHTLLSNVSPIIICIYHYQIDPHYQMYFSLSNGPPLLDVFLIIKCIHIIRCISHYQMDPIIKCITYP
jgi:hypothetical protein